MYVYNADTYCDACGAAIYSDLGQAGNVPTETTPAELFPQYADSEACDYPDHCGSGADCIGDAVDLRAWGMPDDPSLLEGAESFTIGELLSPNLTDEGAAYLLEMVTTDARTPYQAALHAYWRETFSDALHAAICEDARKRGQEDGRAAGTWVIDGNTDEETARAILQGIEEGDPAVYDHLPAAPLSGEWADGSLPRDILHPYGIEEMDNAAEDILSAYEDGYAEGSVQEVERSARAIL